LTRCQILSQTGPTLNSRSMVLKVSQRLIRRNTRSWRTLKVRNLMCSLTKSIFYCLYNNIRVNNYWDFHQNTSILTVLFTRLAHWCQLCQSGTLVTQWTRAALVWLSTLLSLTVQKLPVRQSVITCVITCNVTRNLLWMWNK